jgi:hypothetical protein
MNDLCENIQQWFQRDENDTPEKRAVLLTKICRLFYSAAAAGSTDHFSQEQQGITRILESAVEHRLCVFVDTRRQSASPEQAPRTQHSEK